MNWFSFERAIVISVVIASATVLTVMHIPGALWVWLMAIVLIF